MSGNETEIYRLHVEGQARLVHLLLGVAAAAIAFALHQTSGQGMEAAHAPFGIAVICWAASFASGASGLGRRQNMLRGRIEMLKLKQGDAAPPVPGASIDMATAALHELVEAESGRAARRFRWQLWLLMAGTLCYLGGHLWAMARLAEG